MSVYSDKSFRAQDYNKFRPTYPKTIFDKIISYHGNSREIELLVDVGCGPGEATFPFTEYGNVKRVLGTDLSLVMVELARSLKTRDHVEFKVASDVDTGLADASVDVVTAAECLHWFNHQLWLREVARVLKDNGTLLYLSYVDVVVMNDPIANEINDNFTYLDPRYCGPLWQQPGKEHLRVGMLGVDYFLSKNTDFHQVETKSYDPNFDFTKSELDIRKDLTMEDFLKYLDTWSAVHSWRKVHQGEDTKDIVELWYEEFHKRLGWTKQTRLELVWKTHYTLARRVERAN